MKKLLAMIIVMTLLSITACSAENQEVQEMQQTSKPTVQQTQESGKPTQTNHEDVISKVLLDYQNVYEETKEDLLSSNGQNIGTEADVREVADDGIKFVAQDGENPFMPLSKRLNEVDGVNNNNQAYYMKFKPSGKDFGIMLSDEVNVGITIGEENEPILFVMDHDYMEPLDTDLRIEPDSWYHVLIAMGAEGIVQGAIWKDGQDDNAAYINLNINGSFNDDRYADKSWHVDVGYKGEATFTIERYTYYTFSSFVMGDRVLDMGSDNQNNMPQSKDDVLYSMLMNPQELWGEGSAGFAENNGGEFGGGVKMEYNADMQRLEIFGEDTGACAQFNTSLMTCMSDVGMDKVPQQAVLVKFSASDIIKDVRVSFEALDEITFSFREDGIYFVDVANFFEMPISDFMPNNLELKNDTTYYYFFSFDAEGNIRMFIWEDGLVENQAYFEYDLYQESADINSCDLMMYLGVGANEQFNIYEYWVYTFDSFMDNSPFVSSSDNQSADTQNDDNDYGPSWAINIGGNFDIMSDMVWQSVEGYALEISGDTYVGYNLAEMMEFSGNASKTARVIFGDSNGTDVEVNSTSEAFIVFKKNDEFLGGPFLLVNDELMEHPVIQVQVD